MFILTGINVRGTAIDHLKAIKDFFLNNTVAPFELVDEVLDGGDNIQHIKLKRDKLYVKIETGSTYTNSSERKHLTVRVYDEEGQIYTEESYRSISISSVSYTITDSTIEDRAINIFISNGDNEENCIICIFPFNYTLKSFITYNSPYYGYFVIYLKSKNYMFFCVGGDRKYSIYKNISDGTNVYLKNLISPPQDISKLVVMDKVEVCKESTGEHLEFLPPLFSAGGATLGYSYTINGKTYFCIQDGICIPIGDKTDYIPATESEVGV